MASINESPTRENASKQSVIYGKNINLERRLMLSMDTVSEMIKDIVKSCLGFQCLNPLSNT